MQNLVLTTAEDTPLSITIQLPATDASTVTLTVVSQPSHGTLTGLGPRWTYTPALNYNGDDAMSVRAEDAFGSATATVTIHVNPVDDAPLAKPDSFAAGFDTPLTIARATLVANDSDIDSTTLTVSEVTLGTHGTPAISGSNIVFTPELGFTGTATFSYTLSDGTLTAQGLVTVAIGEDEAPLAVDDAATMNEDAVLTISDATLLGNDTDAENHTLAISAVTSVSNGSVAHSGNQVTFTPTADFHGVAGFEYTVTDGYKTDVASVVVTVGSLNDAPVANADSTGTDEDAPLSLSAANLLGNDSDVDGDTLDVAAVAATGNTHGTVVLASGIVTYAPDANFNGTAEFSYTVSDGNGGSASGTATVTVAAIDDAPTAAADGPSVAEDAVATAVAVLDNDTDPDGGAMSISSVTQPPHGTVAITGGGTGLTYQPGSNYCNSTPAGLARGQTPSGDITNGVPETFTYTLAPGNSTATVTVTVTCSDDSPVAVNDVATAPEDSTALAFNVLANDTDVDGGSKTVASVTQPANGTASVSPSGLAVSYTPSPDYCNQVPNAALDTFTYTITPGGSSGTVSVTVVCACGENKPTDFVVGSNVALSATTAVIRGSSSEVWFPAGTRTSFPGSAPGATTTATLQLAYLDTMTRISPVDVQIDPTDAHDGSADASATVMADGDPSGVAATAADLAIALTDGRTTVTPGDSLVYTIAAANTGGDDIIGATVADTFPSDLTCSWTCVGNSGGACTAAGSGNIADAVTLPVGGSIVYTASCTLSSSSALSTLSNTATIAPPGPVIDPVPGNNSMTDVDTVVRLPALLTGSKSQSGAFTEGSTVTYTVVLSNDGAGAQNDNPGDEMVDILPSGLALISATASAGTAIATIGTNAVTWNGSIAAGASVTITIVATITATAGTRISNQATFAYDSQATGSNDASGTTDAFVCPDNN